MTTTTRLAQCITDTRGIILDADDIYCEIVRRPRHQVLGRSPLTYTLATDRAVNAALLRRLGQGGQAFAITKRYVRGDHALQWVSLHVSAYRDGAGPTRFVATCRPHREPPLAGTVVRARRDAARWIEMLALAKQAFGGDLIAAPALEMLLHLHLAEMECQSLDPSRLAAAIGQSAAATVRWAKVLAQRELVEPERAGMVDEDMPLRITGDAQRMIESVAGAADYRS